MDQATSEPNDSHTNHCSTRRVLVCVLVVISLCLVYRSDWFHFLSAPGQSDLNQGEGKVAVLCEML